MAAARGETRITKRQKNDDCSDESASTIQGDCKFLQLPRELRDMIYKYRFSSTRLTFGKRRVNISSSWTEFKPAPNSLAILRTCQQIYDEISQTWLGEVLFNFEEMEALLDKLSLLPTPTMGRIRHVRIRDNLLWVKEPDGWERRWIETLVHFIPELGLETLTLLGPDDDDDAERCITELIRICHGWKELRVIMPHSHMLSYMLDEEVPLKQWLKLLATRDGIESEASISVHQATAPQSSVRSPDTRQVFTRTLNGSISALQDIPATVVPVIEEGINNDTLVIVKRGRQANVSKKEAASDGWAWAEGMSWKDVKSGGITHGPDEPTGGNRLQANREQEDEYVDPYDYEW